jgi:hypothetical protein
MLKLAEHILKTKTEDFEASKFVGARRSKYWKQRWQNVGRFSALKSTVLKLGMSKPMKHSTIPADCAVPITRQPATFATQILARSLAMCRWRVTSLARAGWPTNCLELQATLRLFPMSPTSRKYQAQAHPNKKPNPLPRLRRVKIQKMLYWIVQLRWFKAHLRKSRHVRNNAERPNRLLLMAKRAD